MQRKPTDNTEYSLKLKFNPEHAQGDSGEENSLLTGKKNLQQKG